MASAASSAISYSATVNWLRRRHSPCKSTRVPSGSFVASHGWVNQSATIGPDSSATFASTIFTRRLRVGRTLIERMTAATVAFSPMPSDAIGRTSRRSACARGKYSSRSPAVLRPRAAAASPAFFGNEIDCSSRDGCGVERMGVASAAGSRWSADAKACCANAVVVAMPPMIARAADLLDGEQVPPGGLAALVEVQLETGRQGLLDLVLAQRRLGAGNAGDQLAAFGQALDRLAQDMLGVAPRDQLVAGVANGVAGAEASLRVVACGRCDPARHQRGDRAPQ